MSKKKTIGFIKLIIKAGKATPQPPVGPALGQKGINIMAFCKEFNDYTKDKGDVPIRVKVLVFDDKTYSIKYMLPPASFIIKKAFGLNKGLSKPGKDQAVVLKRSQIKNLAEEKISDLNAYDIESALRILEGTARSMGCIVRE